MGSRSLIKFNKKEATDALFSSLKQAQVNLFVEYAKSKVVEIGDTIRSYGSRNHMDRTGNLLDSLCWGVTCDGGLVASGFYREKQARMPSGVHEWWQGEWRNRKSGIWEQLSYANLPEVNGHELAEKHLEKVGKRNTNGIRVFFAILAPYWGYWEKGFKMKTFGGERFVQFSVMTQYRDQIKQELKPATINFKCIVLAYTNTSLAKTAKNHL